MSSVPLVEMRRINRRFGGIHAVNDISVDLFAGEVVGVLGPVLFPPCSRHRLSLSPPVFGTAAVERRKASSER